MRKTIIFVSAAMALAIFGCNRGGSSSSPVTNGVNKLTGGDAPAATPTPTPSSNPMCPAPAPGSSPTSPATPPPNQGPVPNATQIRLEIRPGFNPNHLSYEKKASVNFNGTLVGADLEINQNGALDGSGDRVVKIIDYKDFTLGNTLKVDATFENLDGTNATQCSRSWTVTNQSIHCGPVEVWYQPGDNTCVMTCN